MSANVRFTPHDARLVVWVGGLIALALVLFAVWAVGHALGPALQQRLTNDCASREAVSEANTGTRSSSCPQPMVAQSPSPGRTEPLLTAGSPEMWASHDVLNSEHDK